MSRRNKLPRRRVRRYLRKHGQYLIADGLRHFVKSRKAWLRGQWGEPL